MSEKQPAKKTVKKPASSGIASTEVVPPASNLKAKKAAKTEKARKKKKTVKKVVKKEVISAEKKAELKTAEKLVIIEMVCALLSRGKSLISITDSGLPGMPSYSTVRQWIADSEQFTAMYACAREDQADFLADEMLNISDDASQDEIITDEGKRMLNAEFVQRSKLRIETRKWIAAKLKPKKYGEKITQEHTGPNGDPLSLLLGQIDGGTKDMVAG